MRVQEVNIIMLLMGKLPVVKSRMSTASVAEQ